MSEPTTTSFAEQYARLGTARIPRMVSPAVVEQLKAELYSLIRRAHEAGQRIAAFDKVDGSHDRDPLFLDSGRAATVFHEPVALGWTGPVELPRYTDAVARVGHGLHAREGAVLDWLRGGDLASWCRLTGRRRPAVIETMYVRKSRWSEPLPPHLDHTYLWTDPPSVQVFWLALDRADETNGGLLVDTRGPVSELRHRLVRHGDEAKLVALPTVNPDPPPIDHGARLTLVPCDPGDVVVVDGLVLHGSGASDGVRTRDALAVHVVDLACAWAPENYLGDMTPYEL
ncbi:phytanoyl-CoA dioxygenase family protein [Micromonospora sp. NPDC049645]|uniref:phytanoyl-CoA dioxygenase family protein n=1 Tax=Micromonospora sp. NPDC049645 TaxID=3155508 RepID=UPI00341425B1